jgi:hypothetical protein
LFTSSDRWTVYSAAGRTVEAALTESAAAAVREAREQHDRNCAAAVEFASFAQLVDAYKRWQKYHRKVCRPDSDDCTCRSVVGGFFDDDAAFTDYIGSSTPWATPTRVEVARRVALLTRAVRRVAANLDRRGVVATAASGRLQHGPGRLLITPLTSAPGAPPAIRASQLSEGLEAA